MPSYLIPRSQQCCPDHLSLSHTFASILFGCWRRLAPDLLPADMSFLDNSDWAGLDLPPEITRELAKRIRHEIRSVGRNYASMHEYFESTLGTTCTRYPHRHVCMDTSIFDCDMLKSLNDFPVKGLLPLLRFLDRCEGLQ